MRFILVVVTAIFLNACGDPFDGLSAEELTQVNRFETWAFKEGQEEYITPIAEKTRVWKGGNLQLYKKLWSFNETTTEFMVFSRLLIPSNDLKQSQLVFYGVQSEKVKDWDQVDSIFNIETGGDFKSSFVSLNENTCYAKQIIEGTQIIKTLIVLVNHNQVFDNQKSDALVSCMNKGYYLHLGFQNVANISAKEFAPKYHPSLGYSLVPTAVVAAPRSFLQGELNGQSKKNVLSQLAEILGTNR